MCDDKSDNRDKIHQKAADHLRKRHGISLKDGPAHSRHHQLNRRNFLRMSGLAALGGGMLLQGVPVSAFSPAPLLASLNTADCGDRILVLIRLKGGNDGLNTIVPFQDDEYYNIRPTLAIPRTDLWTLNDEFGMPNYMSELQPFWEEGRMRVVHNVGYPRPNYSHFRSSDIWASASDSEEIISTGWMGRWLDNEFPAFADAPPTIPPALQIGVQANMIFRSAGTNMALSISNPAEFYQIAQSGQLYNTTGLGNTPAADELAFVRTVSNSAFRYAEQIQLAYQNGRNDAAYPELYPASYLGEQLAIVARLIKGRLGTRIFMVSIDGFDTHAEQVDAHPALLNALSSTVKAFYDDLRKDGFAKEVVSMTFSEFGRTIFENGSEGTDHGTGGPMLIFGEEIGQGFHGTHPNLRDVDQYGDPLFDVDFRQVYATVLQDWLCVPSEVSDFTLGQPFDKIDGIVPTGNPPVGANDNAALLGHNTS
ncbi:MAG: DUF1501 domain-containing protein, partial [Bacteroidota bacterium]